MPRPAMISKRASRPDWTMVGVEDLEHDRVLIFASDVLSNAELMGAVGNARYKLTVEMVDIVVAEGPDYATALADLMSWWNPRDSRAPSTRSDTPWYRQELPSAPLEIEAEQA